MARPKFKIEITDDRYPQLHALLSGLEKDQDITELACSLLERELTTAPKNKVARIKEIQITSDRHPELYAIYTELQERGENIPKLVRTLLLREFLPGWLAESGTEPIKVMRAIAALRRNMAATETEMQLLELWCRNQLGEAVDVEPLTIAPVKIVSKIPINEAAETEELADRW